MKNYSNASRVRFETLREKGNGDITANFTAFGTPYDNPIRILEIFNDMDESVEVSFDGLNSHIYCPAHSGRIYDFDANRQTGSEEFQQAKATQAYIRYFLDAPTEGSAFLTAIYASND